MMFIRIGDLPTIAATSLSIVVDGIELLLSETDMMHEVRVEEMNGKYMLISLEDKHTFTIIRQPE